MAKKSVRFLYPYKGYNSGEVAGFEPEFAEKLVTAGIATDKVGDVASGQPKGVATKDGASGKPDPSKDAPKK